ncbi:MULTISPECIES: head maturation protease, ClpP-related [Bacillus amyloliquefaciens group]|uniref:head maturation protease, ClpP-related n=1 Tax=Bacillus amyloliquefaciens group TaxID=1938374 RepID=UPI00039650CE|nr:MULTISPECIES: head maturation protease, ClpP-related [Bacillus amyloliquefaciens group]ERH55272.1 Clp protease [Bacillus amyloliquefaciens EGD-AQ14]MDH3087210.1 Clp protease ClpP [Bacillus velezensis]MEC0405733.1 Clp protease ClpP [Bacillus velezensis]PKF83672.1 Clp protease ClpP [Bacillus velezensis]WEY80389.1 Clp protease ClpP [Bacillus velezensis]
MKNLNDKTAEINLYGEITGEGWFSESSSKMFQEDLRALGDVSEINLYINSPGGDVFEGQAIHSMLQRHSARINVHIDGLAASIASVIAMAGDTITMPDNAMFMIHNPYMGMLGNASEFRKAADDLDKVTDSIVSTYLNKTDGKISEEEVRKLMNEETWLTAEESQTYGFCDVKTDKKEIAACKDKHVLAKFKNVPKDIMDKNSNQNEEDKIKQKLKLELELLEI